MKLYLLFVIHFFNIIFLNPALIWLKTSFLISLKRQQTHQIFWLTHWKEGTSISNTRQKVISMEWTIYKSNVQNYRKRSVSVLSLLALNKYLVLLTGIILQRAALVMLQVSRSARCAKTTTAALHGSMLTPKGFCNPPGPDISINYTHYSFWIMYYFYCYFSKLTGK